MPDQVGYNYFESKWKRKASFSRHHHSVKETKNSASWTCKSLQYDDHTTASVTHCEWHIRHGWHNILIQLGRVLQTAGVCVLFSCSKASTQSQKTPLQQLPWWYHKQCLAGPSNPPFHHSRRAGCDGRSPVSSFAWPVDRWRHSKLWQSGPSCRVTSLDESLQLSHSVSWQSAATLFESGQTMKSVLYQGCIQRLVILSWKRIVQSGVWSMIKTEHCCSSKCQTWSVNLDSPQTSRQPAVRVFLFKHNNVWSTDWVLTQLPAHLKPTLMRHIIQIKYIAITPWWDL